MESFLKHHDKERMKKAMLEQEDTFRQQVHELHRLYRVQRQLMKEMTTNKVKNMISKHMEKAISSCQPSYTDGHRERTKHHKMLALELPAEDYIKYNGEVAADIEHENEIELTLATGSSQRKKEEVAHTSVSVGSLYSVSVDTRGLTLFGTEWGMPKVEEMYLTAQCERDNGFEVEHRMRQERLQRPPWLLHV
ncbi:hypothetical protein HPP92_018172 [Vanilla planifolia]|uniref:Uncharacterized protein n=1 Tax=Vanilla planifolia TaxID=51239 RepID=A0A835QAM4_VANPL|nr:hypothetical protein HPP92_018172 [Vanilla planifolia]